MTSAPTILVVDDVPLFRELESALLAGCGRILTAASAAEALATVAREHPDLVMLDAHLPDRSGEEVCREIRADAGLRGVRVVMIAGDEPEVRARALRAGADDVLAKPLSRGDLVAAVTRFTRFDEPRGLPRVPMAEPVRLRRDGREDWGTIRNLSRGGLFIEVDCPAPEAAELDVEFRLPETGERLRATVQVVWRRTTSPGGVGVRFLDLDAERVHLLDDWVHERSQPEDPRSLPAQRGAQAGVA